METGKTRAEALIEAAEEQNRIDHVTLLQEPARRLITVIANRGEMLKDRNYARPEIYGDW